MYYTVVGHGKFVKFMRLFILILILISQVLRGSTSATEREIAIIKLRTNFGGIFNSEIRDRLCTTWKTLLSDGGKLLDVFSVDDSTIVLGGLVGEIDGSVLKLIFQNPDIVSKYVAYSKRPIYF